MVFSFGAFQLDLATCELRRNGEPIALQPRVFAVLRYLVEHRDRVVGKQELIDVLWDGQQLNAVAVPWTINRVRRALGQSDGLPGFIVTVRGHGYRFVAASGLAEASALPRADVTAELPRPQAPHEPFVGRESVIAQLMAAVDTAGQRRGGLYLLTGDAGIGKTRCLNELAVLVRRRGLHVWLGRCFERTVAPAFWPLIQVVRAACNDATLQDALRAEGQRLLRELEPRASSGANAADNTAAGDARFWLLDRLSRWLSSCAQTQLRVVLLEDLHSADESSLQALALLAPMLAHSRMLVIATARDGVGAEYEPAAASLPTRLRPSEHVPLTGLRAADVEQYLTAVLGENLARQLSQTLSARTAGNPLFVRELARVVRTQCDRDASIRGADVRLPQAVKDIVSARFHALDPEPRALLDAACVIGEELPLPVLQRVTGLSAQATLAGLQAAVAANILELKPDGSKHGFVHPLMREVLYGALEAADRTNLHAAVGVALEAFGLIEPPLNELAYHFHHAAIEPYFERAVRYGQLAAAAAIRVLAYDEAAQFYAWTLEAHAQLAPTSVRDACELLLLSARALFLAGRRPEARRQCERVIELARDASLADLLVRAVRLLRGTVWLAHVPDPLAVSTLEHALTLLPETALGTRAHAYAQLAALPPYSLQLARSQQMSAAAVLLAAGSNDTTLLLEAQRSRLLALSGPDTIDELLQTADEIFRLDPSSASLWSADAQYARYHALMRRGDRLGADRALVAFERIARELRVPMLLWHADRLRAQMQLHAGQLETAGQRFDALWAESQRMRLTTGYMHYSAQRAALNHARTGRRLDASIRALPDVPKWVAALPLFQCQRIAMAIELGDVALARSEFLTLADNGFAQVIGDTNGLYCLARLSLVAATLCEYDAALLLRRLLEPYETLIAVSALALSIGSVARYLGVLEHCLQRRSEAQHYFERAIESNARTGHELERLSASLDLAGLLAESGNEHGRARAQQLAAAVAEAAGRCGALMLSESALELGLQLTAAQRRRSGVPVPAKSIRTRARAPKLSRQ